MLIILNAFIFHIRNNIKKIVTIYFLSTFCILVLLYNFLEKNKVDDQMQFSVVGKVFEQLSLVSSRLEMTRLLADLFKQATPHEANIIANLSLGLLRPSYEGTQFNFAEKNFVKVLAHMLHSTVEKIEHLAKERGDVGSVINSNAWHAHKELTVLNVYKQLSAIEDLSGTGSQEEKAEQVEALLKDVDPISAKYLIRIMLSTLRLGFSDMTLIDALSWMEVGDKSLRTQLENAYNVCADIGLIASTLKSEGIAGIDSMHIHMGIPIRPAAAERMPNARAIIDKLGPCVAQPKLDGFRLQIHVNKTDKHNPVVKFFSRNLIDMSAMFPDLVKAFLKLDVKELICEGEAIVYDPDTESFLPFQETVKRKRKHGIEQAIIDLPLQVYLFDLLYLNGKEFLGKTHEERRKKLLELFKDFKDTTIQVIQERSITSAAQLEDYFLENIAAGLEGLVVKKSDSIYQPGKRNFNWIKLKRHEEGHLEDTLDCVILGYYKGSGKRASFGVGAFLVGVFNPKKDSFETVAKIGTGLKDVEWKELKHRCDTLHLLKKPVNVECAKELYPDVWVQPKIVCVIRADEITLSPLHSSGKTSNNLGFALRFPRFVSYRDDKSPEQTTSINELQRLYQDQFVIKKTK